MRALDFFSQGLRQHVHVEREVRNEPLQSAGFFLQLPEASQLTHAEVGVLLLPGIRRLLGDAELSAESADQAPLSACRMAYTINSFENRDRFIDPLLSSRSVETVMLLSF